MGTQTSSIIEGYRHSPEPRSTYSRVLDLIGHDARFYDLGKSFRDNCYKYTVTFPNRRSIHFSIHVTEATGVHDWTNIIMKKLKEAITADDKLIKDYYAFQGQGYY